MDFFEEKLQGIRNQDIVAFEALYEKLKKPLFTFLFRLTRNHEIAEEVLQEVFLKLYSSPPKPSTNAKAYIFRMAHNVAIDAVKKESRCAEIVHDECIAFDSTIGFEIDDALERLSERDRKIVTLRINGEFKFREISVILELPLGTVLWVYQKAIKQLQIFVGGSQ
ncbi:MAG: RNA polymerase sigma factor [Oscillospiraceae bacterium]|jgi:RNA polymerase sigma-70 factor (ECF subfamily)|nr:RNA polymerase sigma factor [Oscillospiraceae bacterium]